MMCLRLTIGVLFFAAIVLSAQSRGQDTAEFRRPMPPTLLRVFDPTSSNATVTTLNVYFDAYGAGVSSADRTALQMILVQFSDADLQTLSQGTNPSVLGLNRSGVLIESEWRPLVAAYAKALLIDRTRTSDRTWSVVMLIIGIVLGVLGTKGIEFALARGRVTRNSDPAVG